MGFYVKLGFAVLLSPLILKGFPLLVAYSTSILGSLFEPIYLNQLGDVELPTKNKNTNKVDYLINKSKREIIQKNKIGKVLNPNRTENYKIYNEANFNYPLPGTAAYKNAKQLNIKYFVSQKYEYDYIVLGHRLGIEEARKQDVLTKEEELLVSLGYGYDGTPFGEPWGIEKECLEGYQYAQKMGDFLWWTHDNSRVFQAYLDAGYLPNDLYQGVNGDKIEKIETELKEKYHHPLNKRITPGWLHAYKEGLKDRENEESVIELNN